MTLKLKIFTTTIQENNSQMTEKTKSPVGRPSIPDIDKGKNRSFKLTDVQYAKLKLLGGVKFIKSLLNGDVK